MTVGNTGAGGSSSSSVFDTANGFAGVWHLNTLLPDGANGYAADATANGNAMEAKAELQANDVASGVSYNGIDLKGSNEYLIAAAPATDLQFSSTATISAWVKPSGFSHSSYSDIIGRQYSADWRDSYVLSIHNTRPVAIFGYDTLTRTYADPVSAGEWLHLIGIRNGRNIRLYVNGEFASEVISLVSAMPNDANAVTIGAQENNDYVTEFFWGVIDEVRLSGVVRSASWIKLSYANQRPGSTFPAIE
jgi:hypothetical protein